MRTQGNRERAIFLETPKGSEHRMAEECAVLEKYRFYAHIIFIQYTTNQDFHLSGRPALCPYLAHVFTHS